MAGVRNGSSSKLSDNYSVGGRISLESIRLDEPRLVGYSSTLNRKSIKTIYYWNIDLNTSLPVCTYEAGQSYQTSG